MEYALSARSNPVAGDHTDCRFGQGSRYAPRRLRLEQRDSLQSASCKIVRNLLAHFFVGDLSYEFLLLSFVGKSSSWLSSPFCC